jgi:hypothetical protein
MTPRPRTTPPLQNRVLPTGDIVADPGRGLLMGNRGSISRPDRTLGVTRWRTKMWISCVLDWRGRQRDVMPPGRWTALFFLDEATSLAAGHRPCAFCRRGDYLDYAHAWQRADGGERRPWAAEMDVRLHHERVRRTRDQIVRPMRFGDLPVGAMIARRGGSALVVPGAVRAWSFEGYGEPEVAAADQVVNVRTPPATLGALAEGYRPWVHPSAVDRPDEAGLVRW